MTRCASNPTEFNIGREQLLAKAWEFACIDPKLTGYNTSGQSKALDFVWRALGYDGPAKPAEEEPASNPKIYKAKWLRELEGLETDDLEVKRQSEELHQLRQLNSASSSGKQHQDSHPPSQRRAPQRPCRLWKPSRQSSTSACGAQLLDAFRSYDQVPSMAGRGASR